MKLKQSVIIMMAAALPVVSFAASEIPVTKEHCNSANSSADTNKVNRKRFNIPYLLVLLHQGKTVRYAL